MTIWRWDAGTGRWGAEALRAGETVALGAEAILLPLQGRRCGLLAGAGVTVNGVAALPFQVLGDRDEIGAGGERIYFSAEGPAETEPFPGGGDAVLCGRCKGDMRAGEAAVRCPGCGAWHHERAGLACWSYGDCSGCGRPASGISWRPEPLSRPRGSREDEKRK